MTDPRYPGLRVSVKSRNPFALVAAVRHALRRAGVERGEIERFSEQALESPRSSELLEVCREWTEVEGAANLPDTAD